MGAAMNTRLVITRQKLAQKKKRQPEENRTRRNTSGRRLFFISLFANVNPIYFSLF